MIKKHSEVLFAQNFKKIGQKMTKLFMFNVEICCLKLLGKSVSGNMKSVTPKRWHVSYEKALFTCYIKLLQWMLFVWLCYVTRILLLRTIKRHSKHHFWENPPSLRHHLFSRIIIFIFFDKFNDLRCIYTLSGNWAALSGYPFHNNF